MEDNTNRHTIAGASLYNEQPYDTGSSCPSTRLTSCTPSISNVRNGVSVGNALSEDKHWFVLRVSYGRIKKAKAFIEAKELECYVPFQYKEIKKRDKQEIIAIPFFPSLIFVHVTIEELVSLLQDKVIKDSEKRPLLSIYYDHTVHCEDDSTKNPPLVITESAMSNFIHLTSIHNSHILAIASENVKYKLGDEVIITQGEFKNIHGRVARVAGQQRVVVELFDGCFVATAYISQKAMKLAGGQTK